MKRCVSKIKSNCIDGFECNSCTKDTLGAMISCYLKRPKNADIEVDFFTTRPKSLEEAVKFAATSRFLEEGKMHNHQYRIGDVRLGKVFEKLRSENVLKQIKNAKDFDELHEVVRNNIIGMRGIGNLTVYDIALRVGLYMNKEPKKIYLHCGAKEGAFNLKVALDLDYDMSGGTLLINDFPSMMQRLVPLHIENMLCICKDAFINLRAR